MVQLVINPPNPKVDPDKIVPQPKKQTGLPGYGIMLPAILDEVIHSLGAEGAVFIKYDPARSELMVELGRSSWNRWTGKRFKPVSNVIGLVSGTGQVEICHQVASVIPAALVAQAPEVKTLAYTPLLVNGYNLGALWLGHRRKLTAHELIRFTSMSEILADVIYCLAADRPNDDRPLDTIKALVRLLATWDATTYQHCLRTVSWARATARRLGLNETEVQTIGWGALLHDIGKLGIPKSILHKPGRLTDDEWKIVKLHPKMGSKMLEPIDQLDPVKDIILSHHEKFDGSGYPAGRSANEISIGARIIAVVDAYSAMTEDRVYRRTFSHEEAVQEIRACSGTHFDPLVTAAFLIQFE